MEGIVEKEKKDFKLRKLIAMLMCIIALFMIIASVIVKQTFYDQNFLLNQIEKTKYSELVVKETSKNFSEENKVESEFAEVIATSISPTFISKSLKTFVQHTYNENDEDEQSDFEDVEQEITRAIDGYAKKHQLTIGKEEENKIESMKFEFIYQLQKNIGDQYFVIFIENILSAKAIILPTLYIGIILFVVFSFYLIFLIRKPSYLLLRYSAIVLGVSGSMCLLLAGLLYMRDFFKNIAFRSQAILHLMTSYTESILLYFMFVGTILVIIAGGIGLISEVIRRKRNEQTIVKKERL